MKQFNAFQTHIAEQLQSKLAKELSYHGFHHTLEVAANAHEIALQNSISEDDLLLLQTAVWLHDAGFMFTYTQHEETGCELARELLPKFGYNNVEIEVVCGLIDATKIPQRPTTPLQNIIADADLMYLGTSNYTPVANTLFNELKHYTGLTDPQVWLQIQIKFLENHRFHTQYCQKHYEPVKQHNLQLLKQV